MNMITEFEVCDIRAEFLEKTIPVEKAKNLKVKELGDGYFDFFVIHGDTILLRLNEQRALINRDGSIRVFIPEGKPEDTFDVFKRVLRILSRFMEIEDDDIFEYNITMTFRLKTDKNAKEVIERYYSELFEKIGEIVADDNPVPYIGLYLKHFGVKEWKERADVNIEPLLLDPSKYWIRINLRLNEYKGIEGILEKMNMYVEKVIKIIEKIEVI